MANERLPIKFFKKREVDNMRVEGNGDSTPPKFILTQQELEYKSKVFVDTFQSFQARILFKETNNGIIPVVFKTKFIDEASAKTYRKVIRNFFKTGDGNNVLGLAENDELIIKIDSSRAANLIVERFKNTEKYDYVLSAIDSISEFIPFVVKNKSEEKVDYKVKLIDFQNHEQNKAIRNYFDKFLKDLNIEATKTKYSSRDIIFNVKEVILDEFLTLANNKILDAVFSIEPMPKYTVTLDMIENESTIKILNPKDGVKYTTVGILDNGIVDIAHLELWVLNKRFHFFSPFYNLKI